MLYLVRAQKDTTLIYNCCMNFLHTHFLDTFRRGTPMEILRSGSADSRWKIIHLTDFASFGEASAEGGSFTVTG